MACYEQDVGNLCDRIELCVDCAVISSVGSIMLLGPISVLVLNANLQGRIDIIKCVYYDNSTATLALNRFRRMGWHEL